jgi:hypothetical protein
MSYIYHGTPVKMIGNTLLPLNQMKHSQPELYDKYVQKYADRPEVMKKKIPLLNCLWSDVIQFLPIHPKKVFTLQRELGLIDKVPPYTFFQIDLSKIDPSKAVIYFKDAPGDENVVVKWLKDVDLDVLQEVPTATVHYYKSLIGSGELPFNYQFVPHILYLGDVSVSDAAIITL